MLKVTKDRSYREVTVISDEDEELTEARARAFAQAYLYYNESDCADWDLDDIERVNGQHVIVKFVGWLN